jgi:hypothetical protein
MSYGFDADRLLVWLSVRDPHAEPLRAGSLCLRHADAMVVPRGWTLDDRRDTAPRLFRPAPLPAEEVERPRRPRPKRPPNDSQLALAPDPIEPPDAPTVAEVSGRSGTEDPDATVAIPWLPDVDEDDLGGVLAADSPLLARAFRGTDRPR